MYNIWLAIVTCCVAIAFFSGIYMICSSPYAVYFVPASMVLSFHWYYITRKKEEELKEERRSNNASEQ